MNAAQAKKELVRYADKEKAAFLQRFFKTGKGDYAEGDKFLGVNVPVTRRIARGFKDMPFKHVAALLRSPYHEHRLMALMIWDLQFLKADESSRKKIVNEYLRLAPKFVNNWDLVDSSAPYLLGDYLLGKPRGILSKLAKSKNLWERRISIIATQRFIRNGDFADTLKIAGLLLNDPHDLIHKAVGWMLREVGNRNLKAERDFLDKNAGVMPRTMLRYAIEKFPEPLRKKYLAK